MSDSQFFSKRGQREMSAFFAKELIYDYLTNALDADRVRAVEKELKENSDLAREVAQIKAGLHYTEKLSESFVDESVLEEIKMPSSYLQVALRKINFAQWPSGLKLGFEATLVALGVTILSLLVPWHRLVHWNWVSSSEITLSEIDRTFTASVADNEVNTDGTIDFPDEEVGEVSVAGAGDATSTTLHVAQDTNAAGKSTTVTGPKPTVVTTTTAPVTTTTLAGTVVAKSQGELYRGVIEVTNVAAVSPKIVDRLAELGARKAGQVELGWRKGTGSYFHMTIPKDRYQDLVQAFSQYGDLKIHKEKHERVMPDGIIRLIIDVKENEGKAQ